MALLKLYRGLSTATPTAEVGKIWFVSDKQVIKVYNGTKWEQYALTEEEIAALILAAKNEVLGTLEEGDSATLAALNDEIDALQAELTALAAKTVTINEKADGHVKVSKTVDAQGATVYTVTEEDIASAQGLADEIGRATGEEARIEGLVTAEAARAAAAEEALAGRLDVIEGEDAGSIKKAVADAKAELIGDAETLKTFGAVEDAIAAVDAAAKAAATLLTEDSEGHVTVSGQQDEATGAWTYTIGENDIASKAVVDTLIGDDTNMSARAIVQDEVAKQLTSENISESFDTLKEMAEWLSSHPEDVQEMNDAIGANKTAIEAEVLRATTAEGNLQTAIDNEVSAREAAIAALDATVGSQTVAEGKHVAVEVVETDGVLTGLTVVESDIASAAALATLDAEVQDHEIVVSGALNALNERITPLETSVADHETRLTQAEADIDALEAWKEGLNTGVMSVTGDESNAYVKVAANPTTGDVALGVTVASVDAANGGAQGLATDAYVREQIAAAALVWESGSFGE